MTLALVGTTARAQSPLRKEVADIAKQVAAHVRENGEPAVALAGFTGPEGGNGGPGLGKAFEDEFARLKLPLRAGSRLTLGGTFDAAQDRKEAVFVKLLLELKDARDTAGRKFQGRALRDAADVAVMVGATADLTKPNAEVLTLLTTAIEKPTAHISAERVAASDASPFAVEVWVKNPRTGEFAVRKPAATGGQAFVDLKKDDVYAVRLVNKSDHEVAAYVTIDGIDLFAFSEAGEKAAAVIAPAGKEAMVRGWPIDAKRSDEFLVAEYGKTAAARLKASAAGVGVVTVRFAPCWPEGSSPPPDETRSGGPLGTALGERIDTPFRPVKRTTGAVRAVVSVRYTR